MHNELMPRQTLNVNNLHERSSCLLLRCVDCMHSNYLTAKRAETG